MAVSRLITLFESLEPRTTPKSRRTRSPAPSRQPTPPPPQPQPQPQSSLPFSDFGLFLHIHDLESTSHTTMTSTPPSSITSSPSSSLRTSKRYSRTYSPFSSLSSRFLLRRQPSAVDIALQDERNATGAIGVGLTLMEPRPVLEVPISIGTSHIFDGIDCEEEKQPFVMGGILEVMEGTC